MAEPDYFRQKAVGPATLLGLLGMAAAIAHSALYPPKPPPLNYADGTYRNKDCGTIQFRGGTVIFGSNSLYYTLEHHKDGLSALPSHMIEVEREKAGCRVVFDASQDAMYLLFGFDNPPRSVELWDVRKQTPYVFDRQARVAAR